MGGGFEGLRDWGREGSERVDGRWADGMAAQATRCLVEGLLNV
jgi:hypothetical protein